MGTDNKFADIMAKRSYAELHEIVVKLRNEYEPEAVVAAEAEVHRRNLAGEKFEQEENVFRKNKLLIAEKANAPLQIHWKILTLLLPGLINLIIADELKENGYERQYKEIWLWFFYGAAFYIGLLILVLILAALLT
jgi:hypothetical protein